MMQPPTPLPSVFDIGDAAVAMARYRSALVLGVNVEQEARRLAELMAGDVGIQILAAAWETMRRENERELRTAVHGSADNVVKFERKRG